MNYMYAVNAVTNVVTIDGKRGSGKSRLASGLRETFNCGVIDIGPLFRFIAWLVVSGRNSSISAACEVLRREGLMAIRPEMGSEMAATVIEYDGLDDQHWLWDPRLDATLLHVSEADSAKETIKAMVRGVARNGPTIIVGRNTGLEIFPEARLKIELVAEDSIRELRKISQLSSVLDSLGTPCEKEFEIERAEPRLVERIYDDIVQLDTTHADPQEVLQESVFLVIERLGWPLKEIALAPNGRV